MYKIKFYTTAFQLDYGHQAWEKPSLICIEIKTKKAAEESIVRSCSEGFWYRHEDSCASVFIPAHSIVRAEFVSECEEAEQWNEDLKKMAERIWDGM